MRRLSWPLAVVILLGTAGTSNAQTFQQPQQVRYPLVLEALAGIVIPTGDFADITNPAIQFSGYLGYNLNPRLLLMGNGNLNWHPGAEGLPDWYTYSGFAMLGINAAKPRSDAAIIFPLGAGLMVFNPSREGLGTNAYFAVAGGGMLTYWFADQWGLALSAMINLAFVDEEIFGSSTQLLFPFTAGLALRM